MAPYLTSGIPGRRGNPCNSRFYDGDNARALGTIAKQRLASRSGANPPDFAGEPAPPRLASPRLASARSCDSLCVPETLGITRACARKIHPPKGREARSSERAMTVLGN